MQGALRLSTWVQPGGKVELLDPQLLAGTPVDVIVLVPQAAETARPSILDVLASAPGNLAFRSSADVDTYLAEERDAWER